MAKTVITYVCDICGDEYTYEEGALECAKSHKIVECIDQVGYEPGIFNSGYPNIITIKFKNGIIKEYKISDY